MAEMRKSNAAHRWRAAIAIANKCVGGLLVAACVVGGAGCPTVGGSSGPNGSGGGGGVSKEAGPVPMGESAMLGGAKVTVVSANVEEVEWSDEALLIIRVQVENPSETKIVRLTPWHECEEMFDGSVFLADEHSNAYKHFWDGSFTEKRVLRPGESTTVSLPFERPVELAKNLSLSLTSMAFEGGTRSEKRAYAVTPK